MSMGNSFQEILHQYKIDCFWDTPLEAIDQEKHRDFVMERLLDFGGMDGIRWVFETYGAAAIQEVVRHSRRLSRSTAGFWANYFSIPREQVRCLLEETLSPLR